MQAKLSWVFFPFKQFLLSLPPEPLLRVGILSHYGQSSIVLCFLCWLQPANPTIQSVVLSCLCPMLAQ